MTGKPIVRTLASAAAPTLRAWVDAHASIVESVVEGALAVPDDVVLVPGANEQEVFTPLAFGDVADLKDDGLSDEERKRALAWLKKRAAGLEGDFDAEDAHRALSLLPGWSSAILPGGMATSYPEPEHYSYPHPTKERSFWVDANTAALYAVLPKGKKGKDMPAGLYAEKVEPFAPIFLTNTVMSHVWGAGLEEVTLDKPVAAVQTVDGPMRLSQNQHFVPFAGTTLYLVVRPVLVAPSGKATLRVTNATGQTAEVSGKAAWKALYALGLQGAAERVVGTVERRVRTRAAFAEGNTGWGGAMCPVCFQRAAVTPTSRHMVDHRHTRPGVGFNVQPCAGNQFPPYKESLAGVEWMLASLRNSIPREIEQLRRVIAHPEEQSYPVVVYVKDAQGRPVFDPVPPHLAAYRGEKKQRTKTVVIRKGHPRFRDFYAQDINQRKASIRATADAIPFYVAAVRVWKQGLDTAEPIYAGIRQTDKPALPADLFGAA